MRMASGAASRFSAHHAAARSICESRETETIARQFYYAEMLGKPVLLNESQVEATRQRFSSYGQGSPPPGEVITGKPAATRKRKPERR